MCSQTCLQSILMRAHPNQPFSFGRKPFQSRRQVPLQQGPRPVQPHLDRALGDAQRRRRFADIHFFDVPEQHDVTVNLRQPLDGLAQDRAQLLLFQRLGRNLAPTGQDGRGIVAGLLVSFGVERVFAADADLAQPAQAFIARNREHPGAELRVAAKLVQVQVDLDRRLLRRVFGFGFVLQQRKQQKVDGALAGADQVMKQVLFARQNAADALGFEFRIWHASSLFVTELHVCNVTGWQSHYSLSRRGRANLLNRLNGKLSFCHSERFLYKITNWAVQSPRG